MGLFNKGKWEVVERKNITVTTINQFTQKETKKDAVLIIERNSKTFECRAYTKDSHGNKTDWDWDYVRTNILEE